MVLQRSGTATGCADLPAKRLHPLVKLRRESTGRKPGRRFPAIVTDGHTSQSGLAINYFCHGDLRHWHNNKENQ